MKDSFDIDGALLTAGINREELNIVSVNRCFEGLHLRIGHYSASLCCDMIVGVYLPPIVLQTDNVKAPALYWLSGLTCTDQNFLTKSGAMHYAAKLGLVLICPDTSPRGTDVADDDAYDLGQGAGFYIDATQSPWSEHYQMYTYVADELINWCQKYLPLTGSKSISGHSMGGHGALTIAFRNPGTFASVSAFAPICNPVNVPWGQKAFSAYLGNDTATWKQHDATELLSELDERLPLLIDQGAADQFLAEQLGIEAFSKACEMNKHSLELNMRAGYDHSYFFIASFIGGHLEHHARALDLI